MPDPTQRQVVGFLARYDNGDFMVNVLIRPADLWIERLCSALVIAAALSIAGWHPPIPMSVFADPAWD